MRTRWLIATLILVIALGSALPTHAQSVVTVSIDDVLFDEFPTTKALITVRNKNGVPIVGLGPNEFEIIEDGKASFPPSEVTAKVNPDAPISIVLVIDISGSMKGTPIKEAIRAANALIDQLSPQDRGAIIAFADHVDTDPTHLEEGKEIGFTTDKNALRNVVNFLDTKIGWDTPLYDAIYKGVKMVAAEPPGKRAVVVMTDGRDERDNAQGIPVKDAGSFFKPYDPVLEANQYNIPVFSIGLVGLGGKIDDEYLKWLAERTGGIYQQAPAPEDLAPLFQNVVSQLKQQYVLTYNSSLSKDDHYHSLVVRVRLPQGQAFNEIKFHLPSETIPTSIPSSISEITPTKVAQEDQAPLPNETPVPTPTPTPPVLTRIMDTLKKTFEERPALAVVIGIGVLLLIILIIALLAVLLRGRRAKEKDLVDTEPKGSVPTESGTSVTSPPTGVAPPDWPGVGTGTPVIGQPPSWAVTGPGIPPAGGTRIIERAPKHLAMLVDKSRPDRKYDLRTMTNVGRARENQIILDDPTVSRHHAWIKADGEDFLIFDVGSANGTYVNDQRVTEPRRLQQGDIVRFGEATFVFTKIF